ncbi:sodium channel subunit beta-3 isoform X1 [Astyanax mexicanus]|uniref:Sodium channel regulatory subunit beta-3 n=1 Tax=Astyanax mexicanus TaxID=7994 RepID=A0A8T2L0L5_ASTMX|nr:sodium channel subunit beta-3 isoform X1 [Astyanax mexicanus]
MITHMRTALSLLSLLMFAVQECRSVCVDPYTQPQTKDVETEAVLGKPIKLTCISCMKREEIEAKTKVDWYFYNSSIEAMQQIYEFNRSPPDEDGPWKGRLLWNGSKDLQDVSISITNVTLSDAGRYMCVVSRTFSFNLYTPTFTNSITINLVVREKASRDSTALYSEIMMYVLLVFLTFWLLVEMIYCYRKISKADEQAQDSATDYLAIPSENKENPGPAVTE